MATLELMRASGRTVAFVAKGTEVEVNRLVDDDLLPERFYCKSPDRREFDLLGAAIALRFNRRWKDLLTKRARKDLMAHLDAERLHAFTSRLESFAGRACDVLATGSDGKALWVVEVKGLSCDLTDEMNEIGERMLLLAAVGDAITADPEVMGGMPVFTGSRLPIGTALASLDAGVTMAEMIEDYPFLTEEKIELARVHVRLHPKVGRPRKTPARSNPRVVRHIRIPAVED